MQSLIKQASLQTTDHVCGPYAELTAFVSNSWIGIENLNNFVLHYKKFTMLSMQSLILWEYILRNSWIYVRLMVVDAIMVNMFRAYGTVHNMDVSSRFLIG